MPEHLEPIAADGTIPASVMSMVRAGLKYKKTVTVKAVQILVDIPLRTVLKNGTLETERIVPAGSFIVTNPSGEQYGINAESFAERYEATDVEGVYLAKGEIYAIRNPYKVPISILASWGKLQHGSATCWLAVPVGSDGTPYIIGDDEFAETYG